MMHLVPNRFTANDAGVYKESFDNPHKKELWENYQKYRFA